MEGGRGGKRKEFLLARICCKALKLSSETNVSAKYTFRYWLDMVLDATTNKEGRQRLSLYSEVIDLKPLVGRP